MRHPEGPAGSSRDLRFNFPVFVIPSAPVRPVFQVLEEKIFTLNSRKVFSPVCVQTRRDVPPRFLPSPSPELTHLSPAIIPQRGEKFHGKTGSGLRLQGRCVLPPTRNCNCVKAAAGTQRNIVIIPCQPHNFNSGSRV